MTRWPTQQGTLKPPKKLGKRHFEAHRQNLQRTQAGLFLATFKIRDECPSEASVDGQVRLRPFTLLPQPANSLAQADTNIGCHQAIMAVFFRLHFAYRIQSYPVLGGESPVCSVSFRLGHDQSPNTRFGISPEPHHVRRGTRPPSSTTL
jgi:hypothetical protein